MSLLNAWLLLVLSVGSIQPWKLPLIDKYTITVLNSVGESVAVECKSQKGGRIGKGVQNLKIGSEFWFQIQKKLFAQNGVYTCTAVWEDQTLTFPAFNKKMMADNTFDLRPDAVYLNDEVVVPWEPVEARDVKAEAKRDLFSDMSGLIQTRLGAMASDPNSVVSMVRSSAGTAGNVAVAVAHQAVKRQENKAIGYGEAIVHGGDQKPNVIPGNLPLLPEPPVLPNYNVIGTEKPKFDDSLIPIQPQQLPLPVVSEKSLGPNEVGKQCPFTTPDGCTSTTETCKGHKNKKHGKGCGKIKNKLHKKYMKAQRKAEQRKAKLERSRNSLESN